MISIMALRAVVVSALAVVQGLSVVAAGDRTHVLIEVDGAVAVDHEMLSNPPRIVVDMAGANFDLPQRRFTDIDRGGVLGLRSSQFQAGVVRVVIDLAEAVDYQVEEVPGGIRISFPNPQGAFDPWTSGTPARAAAEADPLGAPAADRAATDVPVSRPEVIEASAPAAQQPEIWVEFRNTPIVDVLGTFADFSGRSIVPGQGVRAQTVTATIQGQPWDEAMRAILGGQGLAAREMDTGIIMVTSLEQQRQREEQEEIVTEAFPLLYVSADSLAPQVRSLLTASEGSSRGAGTVAINRATNALIVSAGESVVNRLRNLLPSLDQRTPQVTVQVRILTVRRQELAGLGINYEILDNDPAGTRLNRLVSGDATSTPQVSLGGNSVAAVGTATERIAPATFEILTSLLLNGHSLVTWVEAVQSLDLTELQADPVLKVLDHRTAKVHVGERVPIRVVDPGAATAQGPQAQVRMEETGVILEITPHVVGDQVLVQLHAEQSEILSTPAEGGYVFGTAEADTEILLDNAQTAVISGLTTSRDALLRSGIPILMDVPVLGNLFRTSRREQSTDDLLIMVTPYIEREAGG